MLHLSPIAGQPCIDIEKLKNGELSTFQQFYKIFYPEFLAEAITKLLRKSEAPNLVKHCFMRSWYKSNEFTSLEYALGFLNYTVCNQCSACNSIYSIVSTHHEHIGSIVYSGQIVKEGNDEFLSRIYDLSLAELGPVREVFKQFYGKRASIRLISYELGLTPQYTQERLDLAFGILHLIFKGES